PAFPTRRSSDLPRGGAGPLGGLPAAPRAHAAAQALRRRRVLRAGAGPPRAVWAGGRTEPAGAGLAGARPGRRPAPGRHHPPGRAQEATALSAGGALRLATRGSALALAQAERV